MAVETESSSARPVVAVGTGAGGPKRRCWPRLPATRRPCRSPRRPRPPAPGARRPGSRPGLPPNRQRPRIRDLFAASHEQAAAARVDADGGALGRADREDRRSTPEVELRDHGGEFGREERRSGRSGAGGDSTPRLGAGGEIEGFGIGRVVGVRHRIRRGREDVGGRAVVLDQHPSVGGDGNAADFAERSPGRFRQLAEIFAVAAEHLNQMTGRLGDVDIAGRRAVRIVDRHLDFGRRSEDQPLFTVFIGRDAIAFGRGRLTGCREDHAVAVDHVGAERRKARRAAVGVPATEGAGFGVDDEEVAARRIDSEALRVAKLGPPPPPKSSTNGREEAAAASLGVAPERRKPTPTATIPSAISRRQRDAFPRRPSSPPGQFNTALTLPPVARTALTRGSDSNSLPDPARRP